MFFIPYWNQALYAKTPNLHWIIWTKKQSTLYAAKYFVSCRGIPKIKPAICSPEFLQQNPLNSREVAW